MEIESGQRGGRSVIPMWIGLRDDFSAVALAEGILLERYQLSIEVASRLLAASAAAAGMRAADAARWLVRTNSLPAAMS